MEVGSDTQGQGQGNDRRVLTHRDRDREGRIGQPDCNFPPSARSRVRRDGYAGQHCTAYL